MESLEKIQQYVTELFAKLNFEKQPLMLYEPFQYTMSLGGKRLRPLLVMLTADMFSADLKDAENAAIAVELAHNFTLLHDDIMDASPLRRGKPTVYQKFGTDKAILSGDVMYAKAYEYLLKCDTEKIPALVKTLTSVLVQVCEGQAYDMDFEQRNDVTRREYITMISLKTAVLLAASLKTGAIIANADAQSMNALSEFGLYLGIAFQLQDDILDCWSDLNEFGKVIGSDIVDNKKTILFLSAVEKANDEDAKELITWYLEKTTDFQKKKQRVIELFEKYNVKEDVEQMIGQYTIKALEALDKITVEEERKENLRTLAKQLINRKK
ncbi:MAG: polyprenyl synthetase family protein [Bacteroidales bacterium]|nr:polyprenyl synthetase family protein [Bacteroidales bacterium]